MHVLFKLLCNKKGDGYIDTVVAVLITMMIIVFALNVFSFFTIKQDIDYFAKEMLYAATTSGRTADEVSARYIDLCDELGFSPSYSFTGTDYYNTSTEKVQLGDTVIVTITYETYVKGLGLFKVPITIKACHSGLSQKYWK